jgi:hypothetical protein
MEMQTELNICWYLHHQTAGLTHDIKTANRSFENLAQFKYLGTTVTNQNLIQENIKGKPNSPSSPNLMYSRLLSIL